MKCALQIEFTEAELIDMVSNLGARMLVRTLGQAVDAPEAMQNLFDVLRTALGPMAERFRGKTSSGVPIPVARRPRPNGATVTPLSGDAAPITRCFALDETRNMEAGWGCHVCATYNGLARAACRNCGHTRCDAHATVTPPPGANE